MTSALASFVRRQLDQRRETVRQFSDRTGLNESGLYQILRGERQFVSTRTLDKIAEGFGLTPAEMATAMGRGADLAPDEAELIALWRQVPAEQRPAARGMLQGLAVERTQRRSIGRQDGASTRRKATLRNLEQRRTNGPNSPESPDYTVDTRPDAFVPGRVNGRVAGLVASMAAL